MTPDPATASPAQLLAWVRLRLSARKGGASEAEAARVAKALQRLLPVLAGSLTGAQGATATGAEGATATGTADGAGAGVASVIDKAGDQAAANAADQAFAAELMAQARG